MAGAGPQEAHLVRLHRPRPPAASQNRVLGAVRTLLCICIAAKLSSHPPFSLHITDHARTRSCEFGAIYAYCLPPSSSFPSQPSTLSICHTLRGRAPEASDWWLGGYTQRIANMQHTAAHCTMGRYALPSVVLACLALSCGMLVAGGNAQAMECKELGCGGYVAGQACQCDEVILWRKQDSTAICAVHT